MPGSDAAAPLDAKLLERERELMGDSVNKIDAALLVKPKSKKFQVGRRKAHCSPTPPAATLRA